MSVWSMNNRAHEVTWKVVKSIGLVPKSRSFSATGTRTMRGLRHWVNGDSPAMRRSKSSLYAGQIDDICTLVVAAKYEKYSKSTKAQASKKSRADLVEILTDGSKTVADLGAVVDSLYLFHQEGQG